MKVHQIYNRILEIGCKKITVTGGEPLEQINELSILLLMLNERSNNVDGPFDISIETNGVQSLGKVPYSVRIIMDYKLPSSGVEGKMKKENFFELDERDWIKFVIGDERDFKKAVDVVNELYFCYNANVPQIAFSPLTGKMSTAELVDKMKEEELFHIHVNSQLHKYIWPEAEKEGKEV